MVEFFLHHSGPISLSGDKQISCVHHSLDTGDLIIAGVQPSNAVESRLDVIVFILAFKAGDR